MSGELIAAGPPGLTLRARIINSTAHTWNGSAFVVYSSGDMASYAVVMTEQGSSGVYVGDFPIGITSAGHYQYFCHSLQGVSLAEFDPIIATGSLDWDGSVIVETSVSVPGTLSGSDWLDYVIQVLKRTDKNTEIFESTKDIITDMRRRILFPAQEAQTDITDTISALGDYRMDVESDFATLIDDVVLIDGNDGGPLNKIGKRRYDILYTGFGTGASARGRPRDFCLFGNQVLIGPVPDSLSYVYKINYSTDDLADYDADTVSIPFTDKYRLTLRRGVLAILFAEILKNDEQGAKFGSLYESDLKQIERQLDRNRRSTLQVRYRGV